MTGEDAPTLDDAALLGAIGAFTHDNLHVEVEGEWEYGVLSVDGWVFEGDPQLAQQVGTLFRKYVPRGSEWRANHTGLWLDPSAQGRGFGRAFHYYLEELYREHRIESIVIWAKEVGAYAWHNLGFTLTGDSHAKQCEQSARIWTAYGGRERAQEAVDSGYITQQRFDEVDRLFAEVEGCHRQALQPSDIAVIGAAEPWDEGGRSVWLGRLILTRSEWRGVKKLS